MSDDRERVNWESMEAFLDAGLYDMMWGLSIGSATGAWCNGAG